MRRAVTRLAEIVDGSDKSLAEMMLPDAIHHHARGQRIIRAEQGFGQLETSAAVSVRLRLVNGKHMQKTTGNFVAEIEMIATQVDAQIVRLVFGGEHAERLLGQRLLIGDR